MKLPNTVKPERSWMRPEMSWTSINKLLVLQLIKLEKLEIIKYQVIKNEHNKIRSIKLVIKCGIRTGTHNFYYNYRL